MYTNPNLEGDFSKTVQPQYDYSKLPVLTTRVPKVGRQAKVEKKHKKYWQRRRKRKKHQSTSLNNKKLRNKLKNDYTKSELSDNQIQDKIVFLSPVPEKGSPVADDTDNGRSDERHPDERRSDKGHSDQSHSDKGHSDERHSDKGHSDERHSDERHSDERHSDQKHPDNSEAIINQIAQHVSDTYSMKQALTKYKSISERRQSGVSERASEAESYTRPMVVARAIQGTPTTARPKSYSNAVTPHGNRYTFQTHPNSFSFFNLGHKDYLSHNQLLPQSQPTRYSHPTPAPTLPIMFTSPAPAFQRPQYVPLSIGLPPLTPVPTVPSVKRPFHQSQTTSTQFLPSMPVTHQPTRPTSRLPQSQAPTRSPAKKEEPKLSVISPTILTEGEEDERPVKKGRNSFASREADFLKLALDDQQTLALNELLLQVTEMKKRTAKLELDNSFLRSQVRAGGDLGSESRRDCDANFIDSSRS